MDGQDGGAAASTDFLPVTGVLVDGSINATGDTTTGTAPLLTDDEKRPCRINENGVNSDWVSILFEAPDVESPRERRKMVEELVKVIGAACVELMYYDAEHEEAVGPTLKWQEHSGIDEILMRTAQKYTAYDEDHVIRPGDLLLTPWPEYGTRTVDVHELMTTIARLLTHTSIRITRLSISGISRQLFARQWVREWLGPKHHSVWQITVPASGTAAVDSVKDPVLYFPECDGQVAFFMPAVERNPGPDAQ